MRERCGRGGLLLYLRCEKEVWERGMGGGVGEMCGRGVWETGVEERCGRAGHFVGYQRHLLTQECGIL